MLFGHKEEKENTRMPFNREFIGRSWKADHVYEVGREKIREYAVAIGETHPAYLDEEAAADLGHPAPYAPPTFATTLWFRMGTWPLTDPALGKAKKPVCLLGDQRVLHHRPIYVGDRLWFRTTVKEIRDIGRHELLHMEHRIEAESGEPVTTINDKMISRGTAAGVAA
ncbi:MaoC family dehydratase N-terminal domain-containing protein [Streptomyces sp. RB6PN25]|uniref:MaoC family dehydratase N-terminal domain-containing protein n=1 Tax=Streptomyces humicola TaxID=2953240 RepID=A0ABT1Q228_9ACTN|nr:MaoC family dehydratase N-terminal domain-containing protein [Streptomyces humicola]MCQ4082792.1 MaoC family dehydratase N-terminal domain-containing protein [Streptomyces humicola]